MCARYVVNVHGDTQLRSPGQKSEIWIISEPGHCALLHGFLCSFDHCTMYWVPKLNEAQSSWRCGRDALNYHFVITAHGE